MMCNADCISFVISEVQEEHAAGLEVLEVGSLDVNGTIRPWIEAFKPKKYTGVDISEGPRVDYVCDATELLKHFNESSVDLLVSSELMEHVRDWRTVLSNFKRVLRPGGYLMITTRSIGFHYHGYPFDFWRYELSDIESMLSDFEIVTLRKDRQHKGVFVYARKPVDFKEADLSDHQLHSIVARRRVIDITERDQKRFDFFYSFTLFRRKYLSSRLWKGERPKKRFEVPLEEYKPARRRRL